jgi:hypothetical protein
MPTETDYRTKIKAYEHGDLLALWQHIQAGNTPDWDSGKAFEYLILRAFELEGAEVRYPYRIQREGEEIEQLDGIIYSDNLACLVESKHFQTIPTNFEPIAKLRNQLLRRPAATIGMVFSFSGFTAPALLLAEFVAPQTILLWNGNEISFALERQIFRASLIKKYRYAIEHGMSYLNIEE